MIIHASQSVVPPEFSEELKPVKEDGTGRYLKGEIRTKVCSTKVRGELQIVSLELF